MSRRPALITQADVARAIRAAQQCGAEGVEVKPDGSIHISLRKKPEEEEEQIQQSTQRKVIL
jgi:hypothetical protein